MSGAQGSDPKGLPLNRAMITATVMLASTLQALDNTIANVALPRMQGNLSATQDQMTWVLTSYIIAAAIMTPLSGWLADRFGRKPLFVYSLVGFIVASTLCGMAQSLDQIVLFRVLQGLSGAALVPMSQAVLFDTYPPEQHGRAMSIWGIGVVIGPTLAPMFGGWLTDNYSWRWVFYINVPLGILAILGVLAYLPNSKRARRPFDFFGFSMLSIAIAFLQIFLDRGPIKGWFESTEIRAEAAMCALAFYLFMTHTLTARNPFIRLGIYKDRNFASGTFMIFVIGVVLFANLALISPMLQRLMNYSVLQAGSVLAPRGLGTLAAMLISGYLVGRFDPRLILSVGLGFTAFSLYEMSHFSMMMGMSSVIWTGVIQGMGTGIAYVPMAALTFATLPSALRNQGTALFSLIRNLGSSVGISTVQGLMVHNTQVVHATLAGHVTPRVLSEHMTGAHSGVHGAAALNGLVNMQATMIAYLDDFHLMLILTLLAIVALVFVRKPTGGRPVEHVVIE